MTVSKTEQKAADDDAPEAKEPYDRSDLDGPLITFEGFRAAGVGILSDEEIDDLIACVHEWRHEWIHRSEVAR
jgi:hypothetical protein